jgi:hypothetical protein
MTGESGRNTAKQKKGGTFRHRPIIRQSKNQPVQPCVKQGIPIT